jgi:hypothetical protein
LKEVLGENSPEEDHKKRKINQYNDTVNLNTKVFTDYKPDDILEMIKDISMDKYKLKISDKKYQLNMQIKEDNAITEISLEIV